MARCGKQGEAVTKPLHRRCCQFGPPFPKVVSHSIIASLGLPLFGVPAALFARRYLPSFFYRGGTVYFARSLGTGAKGYGRQSGCAEERITPHLACLYTRRTFVEGHDAMRNRSAGLHDDHYKKLKRPETDPLPPSLASYTPLLPAHPIIHHPILTLQSRDQPPL